MAAISEARQKCIDACLKGMKLQHAVVKYKVDVPRDAKSPAYRKLDRLIAKLKREKIFVQVSALEFVVVVVVVVVCHEYLKCFE